MFMPALMADGEWVTDVTSDRWPIDDQGPTDFLQEIKRKITQNPGKTGNGLVKVCWTAPVVQESP